METGAMRQPARGKSRYLLQFWIVGTVLTCSTACGQDVLKEFPIPAALRHSIADGMVFSPKGDMLALPRHDGSVDLLGVSTGMVDVLARTDGAREQPSQVAFSQSGAMLAVSNPGVGLTLWNAATKQPRIKIPLSQPGILALRFLHNEKSVEATTWRATEPDPMAPCDFGVVRWDTATGQRRDVQDLGRHPLTLTISPDARYGVIDQGIERRVLRDFKEKKDVFDLGSWKPVVFTADSSNVVFCEGDEIVLREVPSGRERRRLRIDPPGLKAAAQAVSADAGLLAVVLTAKNSRSAGLISLQTGKVLATVTCGPELSSIRSIQLSPDGHTLATNTHAINTEDAPTQPDLKLWEIPADW